MPFTAQPGSDTASVTPLVLTLFGPMQVLVHGQPLPHLRSRKALWLLALLTLRHDRPVEREWLAATLWPDIPQNQASANLRVVLSELRKALGQEGGRLQTLNRHTLLLDLTNAQVDLLSFEAALQSRQLHALEQAVARYRGPLLEGCPEEWVFQEQQRCEQGVLQALYKLAEAALANGEWEQALGHYQRAVALDPYSDSARRGWMEALAKRGDRNGALQVYREFVDLLRADPRAAPDEQTTALYVRLRAEAREKTAVQAVVAVQEESSPRVSGYLPHPLTDLVGREDERLEVVAQLRRSRLVTLTGLGGIGKTRLALEVALESRETYAGGVWLVALEALSEGGQVIGQIASVLGVREEVGRTLLASVIAHLRSKRLLLVLDNCEHLLSASAQVTGAVLSECGGVRILATSREALGIGGEVVWRVPALATPDPPHLPSGRTTLQRVLMGYESVQLFVERAQAVQKGFGLTGSNAPTVARICARLEGLPLAIELAAARVKVMTVEQMAERLDDHLSLLTGGSRTALSRQQTLRGTLDWSYALLSEEERALLRQLAVFSGGWTLEAAEAVVSGQWSVVSEQQEPLQSKIKNQKSKMRIFDALASLVDKSLVVFEEREGTGRYRLLEMVRQYAREKLKASGEEQETQIRHRAWAVAFVEEADLHLEGADQGLWSGRLETEHDNLRAALAWCETDSAARAGEAELRLVGGLWRFWDRLGYHSEGRQYLEQALGRQEAQGPTAARARAMTGVAALAYRQGDYALARERHTQALSILRTLGDRRRIAASLANQGAVAWAQGDYGAAQTLLEDSLGLHRDLENRVGIAATLCSLGQLVQWQGNYAAARPMFEESLSLRKEVEDHRGIAFSLESLGLLNMLQGKYSEAEAIFEETLDMRRSLGDKYGIALSLGNLGLCARYRGDPLSSQPYVEEALDTFRALGDRQGIGLGLGEMGVLAKERGDYAVAQAFLEEGLAILRQSGDRDGIAFALSHLGHVVKDRGNSASAQALFQESLEIRRSMGNRQGMAESLEGLAAVMLAQAETEKAVHLWGASEMLRNSLGAPLPLNERERYDRQLSQARLAMGEDAFATAWEEGRTQTWEQAVEYALSRENNR